MKKKQKLRKNINTKISKDTIVNKGISTEWYYIIKYIAIIAMLIEHTAFTLGGSDETLLLCRMIGRLAFPLFAFELVECFHFTKNKKKHLLSLGLLAIISELPFDITFSTLSPTNISADAFKVQNVCFTFFLGFLMLCITNVNWNNVFKKIGYKKLSNVLSKGVVLCTGGIFVLIATLLRTDYAWRGIALIFFFEFARKRKHIKFWQAFALAYFIGSMGNLFILYLAVPFVLIPIYLSESKKELTFGNNVKRVLTSSPIKFFGRIFYPLHLLILALVKLIKI